MANPKPSVLFSNFCRPMVPGVMDYQQILETTESRRGRSRWAGGALDRWWTYTLWLFNIAMEMAHL